jgi:hypothetical protein
MRAPHFVRLAQIDEQRFITGCRSGVIHLTWERITARFSQEEFRRLAALLQQAVAAPSPASLWDGPLHVTCRPDEEYEFRMGPLVLLLAPGEFRALAGAAQEAAERLEEILASGVWDEPEPEETPPDRSALLGRTPFSQN